MLNNCHTFGHCLWHKRIQCLGWTQLEADQGIEGCAGWKRGRVEMAASRDVAAAHCGEAEMSALAAAIRLRTSKGQDQEQAVEPQTLWRSEFLDEGLGTVSVQRSASPLEGKLLCVQYCLLDSRLARDGWRCCCLLA